MGAHFLTACLLLPLGAAVAPIQDAGWTLPKAEADRWVARLRALARDGWTVSARGNDLVLQRDRPVRFARIAVNAPPGVPGQPERPPDLHEGVVRLTFRFGPRLSLDE